MGRTTKRDPDTIDRMELGKLYATTGALAACEEAGVELMTLLDRHARGDRGELGHHDPAGGVGIRVKASYPLPTDRTVWLITEPDRTVTLLLLPEEL